MSPSISRREIAAVLKARGFDRVATKRHAEHWVSSEGESINLKMGERFSMVVHPRHESRLSEFLAIDGVIRSPDGYAYNSNFVGFPKRMHTGEKPIDFGLDFGFGSASALGRFLDALAGAEGNRFHTAVFDSEAQSFLDGFMEPDNPQFVYWLPRYTQTLQTVRDALQRGEPDAIFDLVWKTFDNSVSKAGPGILDFVLVNRLRDRFVEIIREIHEDGSAGKFDVLVSGMER